MHSIAVMAVQNVSAQAARYALIPDIEEGGIGGLMTFVRK